MKSTSPSGSAESVRIDRESGIAEVVLEELPEVVFHLRRISYSQRLAFLADNFELIRKAKILQASGPGEAVTPQEAALVELALCRKILGACLIKAEGATPDCHDLVAWLLEEAPQAVCTSLLAQAGALLFLGEAQRKK
jgi:hypothetical protein